MDALCFDCLSEPFTLTISMMAFNRLEKRQYTILQNRSFSSINMQLISVFLTQFLLCGTLKGWAKSKQFFILSRTQSARSIRHCKYTKNKEGYQFCTQPIFFCIQDSCDIKTFFKQAYCFDLFPPWRNFLCNFFLFFATIVFIF